MQGPIQAGLPAHVESAARIPIVSIVIPAFNVVPYLDACLASVIREVDAARALARADFEIIVVDDLSTDATAERARELLRERQDAHVVTHERNRGPAAARNTGVDASRGDYILFLDSDNTLLEGALPRIVTALFEHVDADVIILGMDMIDVHGKRTGVFYGEHVPADPLGRLRGDPFLLFERNIMDTFCLIRASAARAARYDESLSQVSDWDFWVRAHYEHRFGFAMLEDSVGGYRIRPGQLTQVNAAQPRTCAREMLRIFGKALAMAIRLDLPLPAIQRLLASVQSAGATYCQLSAAAAPAAQPAREQPGQPAPTPATDLATVELDYGGRKTQFALRRNSAGDKERIAKILQGNGYSLGHWAQGRRFLDHYAANVASRPGLIIDAGAHIGASTVYFLESLPNSFVCALEPEITQFKILDFNTRAYRNKTNLHAAIAAVDAEEHPGSVAVRVPAISVPSVLRVAAAAAPMIFKCDIEGGEDDLFSADPAWMQLFPVIIVALHDRVLPRPGAAPAFIQAAARHDFDFVHRAENVFLFNRRLLA